MFCRRLKDLIFDVVFVPLFSKHILLSKIPSEKRPREVRVFADSIFHFVYRNLSGIVF